MDARDLDAFECLECLHEWREAAVYWTARARGGEGWSFPTEECPRCGSVYFEWLSFSVEPSQVFLRDEEHLVPRPKPVVRKLEGRA